MSELNLPPSIEDLHHARNLLLKQLGKERQRAEALEHRLKYEGEWQAEYPTEPGYYWIKRPAGGDPVPVRLRFYEGGSRMVIGNGVFFYRDDIEAFWSKPIEVPRP